MPEQTIAELLQDLETSRERGIEAIIGRGGDISSTAGFKDFPTAIYNIPADNAIKTVYYNDEAEQISVYPNATSYAYLAEFGGITRRDEVGPEGDMQYFLYNTAFNGAVVLNAEGEEVSEIVVPPEILALEGYGDGININYYNRVDLVNKKYLRCIETVVFNGTEAWRANFGDSRDNEFFILRYAPLDTYASGALVCSHFETVNIPSDSTQIGIWATNSSNVGNFYFKVRPNNNMADYTLGDWTDYLRDNPMTVKIARLVPIESALPVDMNPFVKLAASGVVELNTTEFGFAPIKMIFQTFMQ